MNRQTVTLILVIAVCAMSIGSCTFNMCHPYKLNGLCEYVGHDGLPKHL